MKTLYSFLLFLLSLTLLASSCKKEPVDQLSLLPPATQTGANTFGCLVDGAAFVPESSGFFSGPPFKCEYTSTPQLAVFWIAGGREGDGIVANVSIATDSLKISEGETLLLSKDATPGMASGAYAYNSTAYQTNANVTGELTITRLDIINLIVSGTFHFNAVSKGGDTVKITNGRFDVHYMP